MQFWEITLGTLFIVGTLYILAKIIKEYYSIKYMISNKEYMTKALDETKKRILDIVEKEYKEKS